MEVPGGRVKACKGCRQQKVAPLPNWTVRSARSRADHMISVSSYAATRREMSTSDVRDAAEWALTV
jgi:hypothetical protein